MWYLYLILFFVLIMTGGIIGIIRYQRSGNKNLSPGDIYLKTRGKQWVVDLLSCEVVHREYFDEDENGGKIKKDIAIITYQTDMISGKQALYKTRPIFLAADTLRMKINKRKRTVIYYDSAHPEAYYFDIAFLKGFLAADYKYHTKLI